MSRGRRSKKRNKSKLDLEVVILIVASILLAVLIYTKAGYIGQNLSPILSGIMGWIKYIIPIGTFAIAIALASNKNKEDFTKKIIQYAILLLCVTTVITVVQVAQGKLNLTNGFEKAVVEAYEKGSNNIGGGAVGAIFGIALINLLGKAGAIILAIRNSSNRFNIPI